MLVSSLRDVAVNMRMLIFFQKSFEDEELTNENSEEELEEESSDEEMMAGNLFSKYSLRSLASNLNG